MQFSGHYWHIMQSVMDKRELSSGVASAVVKAVLILLMVPFTIGGLRYSARFGSVPVFLICALVDIILCATIPNI